MDTDENTTPPRRALRPLRSLRVPLLRVPLLPIRVHPCPSVANLRDQPMSVLLNAMQTAARIQPLRIIGAVAAVRGLSVLVGELPVPVGSLVSIGGIAGGTGGSTGGGTGVPPVTVDNQRPRTAGTPVRPP